MPDNPVGCTDDANPHAFVVALDRARLPAGPFGIQLDEEDPPIGAPKERTLVDADLSAPGSVAPRDAIGPDLSLREMAERGNVVTSGATIEPDYSSTYELYVHCGIEVLGELNDVWWRTDEGAGTMDYIPDAWQSLVGDDETIEVEVLLTEGSPPQIAATANGHTVTYHPADDVPGCD